MSTQTQYTPEVVQLVGGLDITSPRPTVAPGSLIDCYNYEVSDLQGYSRSIGIEKFDGRPSVSNALDNLYAITCLDQNSVYVPPVGEYLYNKGDDTTECFGVVTVSALDYCILYVYDPLKFYSLYSDVTATGEGHFVGDTTGSIYIATAVANANTYLQEYAAQADTLEAATNTYRTSYGIAEQTVTTMATISLEDGTTYYNPAIGLEWFKNQEYAIADLSSFTYDTNTTTQVFVGDILQRSGGTDKVVIRAIYKDPDDNTQGKIAYSPIMPTGTIVGNYNGYVLANPYTDGTALSVNRNGTVTASVLTVRSNVTIPSGTPSTQQAGLYRAFGENQLPAGSPHSLQGWQELDLGYLFSFQAGTVNGPPHTPGRVANPSAATTQATAPQAPNSGPTSLSGGPPVLAPGSSDQWTLHSGTFPAAIKQNASFTSGTFSGNYVTPGNYGFFDYITLTAFDAFNDLPDDALISGIEVLVAAAFTGTTYKWHATLTQSGAVIGSPKATPFIVSTSATTPDRIHLGGDGDLWGAPLTVAQVKDPSFGVQLYAADSASGTPKLCAVSIIVHYQPSSSIYYFWNGTDDVQAIVTNSFVFSGDWSTNDAVGTIQVVNVQPVGAAARNIIQSGDIMHSSPGATVGVPNGVTVATVSSSMSYAGLPSLSQLQASASQYELITSNFFGNKDWEAIYGVSGAGRAFTYDGFYFRYIFTGLTDTLDIPRHTAFHNFHLCLGYQVGSVFTSVTGEPESFDGTLGAGEYDTADAVHGFLRMNGTTLAILCKNSIQGLNGTDNTNFSVNMLSPYEGAIEYTATDCGKPVYASYKGISTFDQTASYGSFLGSRLSTFITPWLLPRLNKSAQSPFVNTDGISRLVSPSTPDTSVAFAMPIRDRNQYRLCFRDGYIMTLTFSGTSQDPSFTIQRINFDETDTNGDSVLVPLAHSSAVDDNGLDRTHISVYNPSTGKSTVATSFSNYVWELNRGWGWGTVPILAYFTTTHNFFDNPFELANIRKIRAHGTSNGAATIDVAVSANYLSNEFAYGNVYGQTRANAVPQDISLPRDWPHNKSETLTYPYQPQTNVANVASYGRSFSLQFATHPTLTEPPHVVQAILIQTTENKADL